MPGQGKYTTYAADASSNHTLLGRLFKGNSTVPNPQEGLVGKEADARAQVIERAKAFLNPAHQTGDTAIFPSGVNLDFSGVQDGSTPPNLEDVKWKNPGDPANGYAPDVSSPGPGLTEGTSKDVDPELSVEDLKGAGYVPGAPGTGTASPDKTSPTVSAATELGEQTSMGYDVHTPR